MLFLLLACAADAPDPGGDSSSVTAETSAPGHVATVDVPGLPGHDDCVPAGGVIDDATCLAVIAEDGRRPGQSFDRSWAGHDDPDPRVDDADLAWLNDEIRRCTCACCHQSSLGGPGSYFWDLDFGPVWIDSASDWTLNVFTGTYPSDDQFFPADSADRVRDVVKAELDRREAVRASD